jgi:hypothetical protein
MTSKLDKNLKKRKVALAKRQLFLYAIYLFTYQGLPVPWMIQVFDH